MKFCHVKACEDKDIPLGLKGELPHQKYIKESQNIGCSEDLNKELGFLNKSISEKTHLELKRWADYDDAQDNFCILDDNQQGAEYVDLLLNPESKFGKGGKLAITVKIWPLSFTLKSRKKFLFLSFNLNNFLDIALNFI